MELVEGRSCASRCSPRDNSTRKPLEIAVRWPRALGRRTRLGSSTPRPEARQRDDLEEDGYEDP
jgi:hypothetical protein